MGRCRGRAYFPGFAIDAEIMFAWREMSISPEHASHIRGLNVAFMLFGQDLDPDALSTRLGIPAHSSACKGDERRGPKGQLLGHHRQGWWRIDSSPLLTATGDARKDINEHLKVLLDLLLPKRDLVLEFAARGESYFDVLWESTYLYAGTGPLIDAEYLRGVADLGAGMGFDIYQINEEEDQDANMQIHPISVKPDLG